MSILAILLFSANVSQETQCLANAIHYEAKSESIEGKKAVASVVMNRKNSGKFPNTVCRVVSQRNQFSWYPRKNTSDKTALNIASKYISNTYNDITKGSLYFHSSSIKKPRGWRGLYMMTVGRHRFYR